MKDFFKKEDFQALKQSPRTINQKEQTLVKLRNSNMKQRYPIKYVVSTIVALCLAFILLSPTLLPPNEINKTTTDEEIEKLNSFKNQIKLGQTMDEVKELLGEDYTEYLVKPPVWRYDFGQTDGFLLSDNYIDLDAFLNKKIQMHLFIGWDNNNKVKYSSVVYINDSNNTIYNFRLLANGDTKEIPIYPPAVHNDSLVVTQALENLKSKMELGMTMDEVQEIMGSDYQIKISPDNGLPVWNYQFGKEEHYQFVDQEGLADLDGMKQGKINIHLNIVWNEYDLVEQYSALYLNPKDNQIYEYWVWPNGESKDNPIN